MRADTDWFQQAGWGVFTHYLALMWEYTERAVA